MNAVLDLLDSADMNAQITIKIYSIFLKRAILA